MRGALLGPEFSEAEIETVLRAHDAIINGWTTRRCWPGPSSSCNRKGHRLGAGPHGVRAARLGNRSILGDARSPKMQSVMNLKVKFRESFRPSRPPCAANARRSISI